VPKRITDRRDASNSGSPAMPSKAVQIRKAI